MLGLTLDAWEFMSSCLALILCHAASCNHGNIEHTHSCGNVCMIVWGWEWGMGVGGGSGGWEWGMGVGMGVGVRGEGV